MVDDACNASDDLTVLVSQEVFGLAELESSILVLTQRVLLVGVQVRRIVGIASIQVVVKLDESIELSLTGNFANLY
jgi:hypothetical protein